MVVRGASIQRHGREVAVVFICATANSADELVTTLLAQIKSGVLHLPLGDVPVSVSEAPLPRSSYKD